MGWKAGGEDAEDGERPWGWWPFKATERLRESMDGSASSKQDDNDVVYSEQDTGRDIIKAKRQLMLDLDEPTTTRRTRTTAIQEDATTTRRTTRTSALADESLVDDGPTATRTRPRAIATAAESGDTDSSTAAARQSATSRTRPTETADTDTPDASDTSATGRSRASLTNTNTSPTPSTSSDSDSTTADTADTADPESTGGILSRGVASTKLEWWQLLCIALVCLLAIGVSGYMYWKQKKKKQDDKKRREQVEREEKEDKAREVALAEVAKAAAGGLGGRAGGGSAAVGGRYKGKGNGAGVSRRWSDDEDSEDDAYEDYDSMSDGGTIRPRRRYRERRDYAGPRSRRGGGRDGYDHRDRPRTRGRGRRGDRYEGYSDDYYTSDDSYGRPRRNRDADRRDRSHRRAYGTPPSSSYRPTPRSVRDPNPANFRDSVFSTFSAMKSAAVKLKRHEAEVKLEQQLKEE